MAEEIKPQTKIDEVVLAKAIAEGYSKFNAYKLAGGKSENKGTGVSLVNDYLKKNPDLKVDIIKQMERKRKDILDSMSRKKAKGMAYEKAAVAFGIITDKIQLLKGDPTERIEVMPRLIERGGVPVMTRQDRPEIAEETNKEFEQKNNVKKETKNHSTND